MISKKNASLEDCGRKIPWLAEKRSLMLWDNKFKYQVLFYLEHPNCSFLLEVCSDTK